MILALALAGCTGEEPGPTLRELRDPETCKECHPDHYEQWSGSMHAYASEDPVFRALNALGQEETGGELGDFCIQCHAPIAVELGETIDGLNLDEIDPTLLGITCYACHQVTDVEGDHNNPLRFALDKRMRGPFRDPIETEGHPSAYSSLHDREKPESSDLCGSCHDIVTPAGVHIERTFAEWKDSLFANPLVGVNCGGCHMTGRDGVAAEADGVKLRRVHDHRFPGVDIATTPWVETDDQRAAVQELLDDSINAFLCVQPPTGSTTLAVVTLENVGSGHLFPSGATADRRVWVDIRAYEGGQLIWSSGAVDDDQPLADLVDPDLWTMHSTLVDAAGQPTHKFWEAASIESDDLLPVQTTLDPTDPAYIQTHVSRNYLVRDGTPDRITVSVRVRPLPLDLVDELVADGRLDASVRAALPTFTLGPTVLEWTPDVGVNSGSLGCVPEPPPIPTTP